MDQERRGVVVEQEHALASAVVHAGRRGLGDRRHAGRLREEDAERGPAPERAVDLDDAAELADDPVDHRQPEPVTAAGAFGRHVGLEQARAGVLVHPLPVVGDAQLNPPLGARRRRLRRRPADAGGDADPAAAVLQRVARVRDQVHDDLMQLRRVGEGDHRGRVEVDVELHVRREGGARQPERLAHDGGDVDRAWRGAALPADGEDLLDQVARPQRGVADVDLGVAEVAARLSLVHRELGEPEHAGEDVVEVVRDAGGEATDRLEALALLEALLGGALGGHVAQHRRDVALIVLGVAVQAQLHDAFLAPAAGDPHQLAVAGLERPRRILDEGRDRPSILLAYDGQEMQAADLFHPIVSHQGDEGRVGLEDDPDAGDAHRLTRGLEEDPEPRRGGEPIALGLVAAGDVAADHEHHLADGRSAHLDLDPTSVPRQEDLRHQRLPIAIAEHAPDAVSDHHAALGGHEVHDGSAHDVRVLGETQHRHGRLVGPDHPPSGVRDHRVGRQVGQPRDHLGVDHEGHRPGPVGRIAHRCLG